MTVPDRRRSLTFEQADAVFGWDAAGVATTREIADLFGIHWSLVYKIRNGEAYAAA